MLDSTFLEPGDIVVYLGRVTSGFHVEVEENNGSSFSGTVVWIEDITCHYRVGDYDNCWGKQFFKVLAHTVKLKKFDEALNKLEICIKEKI